MNFAAKRSNGVRVYRRIGGRPLTYEEYQERARIISEKANTLRGAKARGAAAVASTLSGEKVELTVEEAQAFIDAGRDMRSKHQGRVRIHEPVRVAPHDMAARREMVARNRDRGASDYD